LRAFDFDGTLYRGDSTVDFYLFCAARRPSLLRLLPRQASAACAFGWKRLALPVRAPAPDLTPLKQSFYVFLPEVKDIGEAVAAFWKAHDRKMERWFRGVLRPGDVILSASPRFLLEPMAERLNASLIASEVDPRSGLCLGPNCRGEEKAKRFRERYADAKPEAFYSDNASDAPMARLASRAFLVRRGQVAAWPY